VGEVGDVVGESEIIRDQKNDVISKAQAPNERALYSLYRLRS